MEKIPRYWSSPIICKKYFLEPATKEYIQKYRKPNEVKTNLPAINIREDGPSRIPTYKDAVKK